jgi:S-adenosyl-L-methionine hydrolase (adenosine-forming)
MKIVTLLSDFGNRDAYTGILKARLLRDLGADTQIIDISHEMGMEDSLRAAMLTKSYWYQFPEGTIHIHALTPRDGQFAYVAFSESGHYFIGTDIGQYSVVFPEKTSPVPDASQLPGGDGTFPALTLFSKLAKLIASGKQPETWNIPQTHLYLQKIPDVSLDGKRLIGQIIYLDNYGNVHTNIHREMILEAMGEMPFRIYAGSRRHQIERVSNRYTEVTAGDLVAVYNQEGFLELAQSRGNFKRFVGVNLNDVVIVEPIN